jgi:Tfp pilus assembly protein PilF
VADSFNNLAALYKVQGRNAAAGPMYKRALAIREKALGAEHPAVATSLGNLGGLLANQGDHIHVLCHCSGMSAFLKCFHIAVSGVRI